MTVLQPPPLLLSPQNMFLVGPEVQVYQRVWVHKLKLIQHLLEPEFLVGSHPSLFWRTGRSFLELNLEEVHGQGYPIL